MSLQLIAELFFFLTLNLTLARKGQEAFCIIVHSVTVIPGNFQNFGIFNFDAIAMKN